MIIVGQITTKYNSGLAGNIVNCVKIDNSGNKWIASFSQSGWRETGGEGLTKFNDTTWTVYTTINSDLPSNRVWDIEIDDSSNIWISSGTDSPRYEVNGHLAKYNGMSWTVYDSTNLGVPSLGGRCISIDESGSKWILQGYNLIKYDGINWEVFNMPYDKGIYHEPHCLAIDKNGNLWMGADYDGLLKFDGVNWTIYNQSNSGILSSGVSQINIDNNGNKWIGCREVYGWSGDFIGNGLVKYNNSEWKEIETPIDGPIQNWVKFILTDRNNHKWIGSFGGLTKFDGSEWTRIDKTKYNIENSEWLHNDVYCMAEDNLGVLWIGSRGLVKYDGVNWSVYDPSNSGLSLSWIRCIAVDKSNNKWIGSTEGGLTKFDGTTWESYNTFNSGLPSNGINFIVVDDNDNKWIGTSKGLTVYDGSSGKCITNTSGYQVYHCIAIDNYDNKWIGTDYGLVKFDGTSWECL